jgi:AICAR transformylase/IMP cyclohydrolase PurH
MVRSASKNHAHVAIVTQPSQYKMFWIATATERWTKPSVAAWLRQLLK